MNKKKKHEQVQVGFWRNSQHPELPKPKVGKPHPQKPQILAGLLYAESKAKKTLYRGWSTCRICHCHNGSAEYSNLDYVWPGGLSHYIIEHDVVLPNEFVDYLLQLVKRHDLKPVGLTKPEIVVVDSEIWNKLLELAGLNMEVEDDAVANMHTRFAHLIKKAERKRQRARRGSG